MIHEVPFRLLTFAAEKAIPLRQVPDLLQLTKVLSDKKCKALNKVHMSDTCASYTMTNAVAAYYKSELKKKLNSCPYSLNVDEATNNANDKIVKILVR